MIWVSMNGGGRAEDGDLVIVSAFMPEVIAAQPQASYCLTLVITSVTSSIFPVW